MPENEQWGVKPNEGYEITLDETQRIDYLKNRRERFIIRPATAIQELSSNSEETTIEFEDDDQPFLDIQLQRAIEYLDSRK